MQFAISEDGQSLSNTVSLPPDTDITVAITGGLQDFAGNPVQPASIHFRTASAAESSGPKLIGVSPPDGAVNVPLNSHVQLRFTHPMAPASAQTGLALTNSEQVLTGTVNGDDMGEVFDFTPDLPTLPDPQWRSSQAIASTTSLAPESTRSILHS